jgi:hypothetical protein
MLKGWGSQIVYHTINQLKTLLRLFHQFKELFVTDPISVGPILGSVFPNYIRFRARKQLGDIPTIPGDDNLFMRFREFEILAKIILDFR